MSNNLVSPKTHPQAVYTSRLINTQQITQQLEKSKVSDYTTSLEELTLDDFNLDELNISEDPQEESSHQTQIEIPPKK